MRLLSCALVSLALISCSSEDPATTPGGKIGGGGQGLLYYALSSQLEIHKLNLATGEDVKLGKGDAPSKTPEGTLIFITPLELAESNEDLAMHRIIVKRTDNIAERWNKSFHAPRLSPDGTRVAYLSDFNAMYVVNRTDGKLVATFEHTGVTDGWYRPTWTPDGRIVAAGGFGNQGLFISDAGLTKMTRFDQGLTQPADPAVSSDGKKVAFVLNDRVHVINIDGTGLKRIDPADTEDRHPSWSPDGSKIVYRAGGRFKFISADGGQPTDLFDVHPAIGEKYIVLSGTEPLDWK
jgi:dipeptidyl aminopeptidase/acylaminoacyl peptidase